MNIHHKKPVDYDAVVQKFAEQQTQRKLLADPIFEESWIFNLNEYKKCLSVSIIVSVKKIHSLNYYIVSSLRETEKEIMINWWEVHML